MEDKITEVFMGNAVEAEFIAKVLEDIKKEKNIKSVDYDESEDYNIENHTLYKVTVEGNADSDIASSAYKNITDKYKDHKIQTSGDVADRNTEVLPKYVLVAAVAFGTVILIIMCDSFVEVFLFLFTIDNLFRNDFRQFEQCI